MYVTKVDTAMKSDFLLYILRKELILVSSHLWQENCGSAHAYSSIWYIQRKTYFKFSWVLKNSGTKSLMLKSSNLFPILPKQVYELTHCFIWHNVAKKKSHKIIILEILEKKPLPKWDQKFVEKPQILLWNRLWHKKQTELSRTEFSLISTTKIKEVV